MGGRLYSYLNGGDVCVNDIYVNAICVNDNCVSYICGGFQGKKYEDPLTIAKQAMAVRIYLDAQDPVTPLASAKLVNRGSRPPGSRLSSNSH